MKAGANARDSESVQRDSEADHDSDCGGVVSDMELPAQYLRQPGPGGLAIPSRLY